MRGRVYGLVRGRGVCRACVEFYGLLYTSITQSTNQFIYTLSWVLGPSPAPFSGWPSASPLPSQHARAAREAAELRSAPRRPPSPSGSPPNPPTLSRPRSSHSGQGDKVGAADALLAAEPADALSRGNDPSSRSTSLKTFTFVTAAATAATEPLVAGRWRSALPHHCGREEAAAPSSRFTSAVLCRMRRLSVTEDAAEEYRATRRATRPCFADGSPKADAPSTSEPRQW